MRRAKGKNPMRVIIDGTARVPPGAKALDNSSKTIVAVSRRARRDKVKNLQKVGAEVIQVGRDEVNLALLLKKLYERGVRRLLLEGGSTLNWAMLSRGLVDEIRIAISPRIVGGTEAKTLVGGEGFFRVNEGIKLELLRISRVGEDLLLTYRPRGSKC